MLEFKSDGKFEIERGTVFTLACPDNIPREEVYNKLIVIDGTCYTCKGIERFALYLDDSFLRKGERIGLLVKRFDSENQRGL